MAIVIKMEEVNNLMATLPSVTHENSEEALPQLQAFCPTIPPQWVEGVVNTHVRKLLNRAIGK